jgi:GNAT superfamily N-acetyltransferase
VLVGQAGVFELRSFRDGRAAAVLQLHDAALEDAGVHGGRGPWEDDLRDVRGTYLDSGGEFLLGLTDGKLVAIGGLLRRSPEEAEIKRMRVHPDFQRRGIGRLLLEGLEGRARALGYRAIRLDTTDRQTAVRQLHENAGYWETGQRQTGRFLFTDYRMALR